MFVDLRNDQTCPNSQKVITLKIIGIGIFQAAHDVIIKYQLHYNLKRRVLVRTGYNDVKVNDSFGVVHS